MATGYIVLPATAWAPLDNSVGNEAPAFSYNQSTGVAPAPNVPRWAFDDSSNEHLCAVLRMPANYASSPVLKLDWYAAAIANEVRWAVEVSAITESDAATPENKTGDNSNEVDDTVDGTTKELNQVNIALTNADGLAANDLVMLVLYRNAEHANDDLVGDAYFLGAVLEYTTT